MVAGIHCRGEDLAFFPPRLFFPAAVVYICSQNAVHIGGFYFSEVGFSSCGLLLIIKKSAGIALFAFNRFAVEGKRTDFFTVRIEV